MNNTIPAVEHTIAVLEYMSSTDSGVTQSEIRQKLQISMSSAYRILQTLLKHRWVRKDDAGRLAVYGATKAAFKNLASQCAAVGCFL